jgi:hypothetical protein
LWWTDIAGLQTEDGSFAGDEWGEIDTRYMPCFCSEHFLKNSLVGMFDFFSVLQPCQMYFSSLYIHLFNLLIIVDTLYKVTRVGHHHTIFLLSITM